MTGGPPPSERTCLVHTNFPFEQSGRSHEFNDVRGCALPSLHILSAFLSTIICRLQFCQLISGHWRIQSNVLEAVDCTHIQDVVHGVDGHCQRLVSKEKQARFI